MLDDVLALIRENDQFFITTHLGPDGDALGSQLALGRFLRKIDKSVAIVNSDEVGCNFDWMPGIGEIEVFDSSLSQHEALAEADVAFVLDTNDEERLGKVGSLVREATATTVLIDHHLKPEGWFDVPFVRDTAAATGELIYEIIEEIDPDLIDEEIATTLYTAIMTDTGSFRYSSVTPRLHRIVADVLERGGIEPAPIHETIYDRKSMPGLRLLGRTLNRIRLRYNGQLGYSVVTQRMVEDTGASWDDKQGFVNYVLSIEGVEVALLFSETSDGSKISFRSEADVRVDEWARHFGGGGHRNAAGAYVKRPTFEKVIEDVVDAASDYIHFESRHAPDEELSPEDQAYLQTLLDGASDSG
ncbi:MAG: bifunctional oligoribonuclease/PAP phosphatase NrnA [Salinibacter sp.]|uniref:bifunctional oligoribonuclease/PAP phosphatase NrnA n=1 Tax=Salinibacter sp. TaxID=2065818 RepID=UPI0035D47051